MFPVCLLTSLLCCFLSFTNLKVTNPISTWCNPIGLMKLRLSEKIVHHLFFLVFYWKKIRNTGNCAPYHCEEKFRNDIIRCMNNSFRNSEFCLFQQSYNIVRTQQEECWYLDVWNSFLLFCRNFPMFSVKYHQLWFTATHFYFYHRQI